MSSGVHRVLVFRKGKDYAYCHCNYDSNNRYYNYEFLGSVRHYTFTSIVGLL